MIVLNKFKWAASYLFDNYESIVKVIAVDIEKLPLQPHIFKKIPFMNAAHGPIGKFQAMKKMSYW